MLAAIKFAAYTLYFLKRLKSSQVLLLPASNRISSRDAMAASIASHADLMNTSRPAVLAVVGMVRCIASISRCLRANGNDRTASCPPAAVVTCVIAASIAARKLQETERTKFFLVSGQFTDRP
jgi:hypothetical protein